MRYMNVGCDVLRLHSSGNDELLFKCPNPEQAEKAVKVLNDERKATVDARRSDWFERWFNQEKELRRLHRLLDDYGSPREIARTEQLAAIHRKHATYKRDMHRAHRACKKWADLCLTYRRAMGVIESCFAAGGRYGELPSPDGYRLLWNGQIIAKGRNPRRLLEDMERVWLERFQAKKPFPWQAEERGK